MFKQFDILERFGFLIFRVRMFNLYYALLHVRHNRGGVFSFISATVVIGGNSEKDKMS